MSTVPLMGEARRPLHRGWIAVFTAIFFQMITYGVALLSFSFWVPGWMKEFHVARATVMYCVTLSYVMTALVSPIAGAAMERWPFRNVIGVGLLCFASGYALLPFVSAPWQIVGIYGIFMGSALAFCGPVAAQTLVAKWFSTGRGLALGVALTGPAFGGVVMPPLVAFLLAQWDWHRVALVMAATGLLAMPVVWLFMKNPPKQITSANQETVKSSPMSGSASGREWTTREILRSRNFWAMVLTSVPVCAAFQGVGANFSLLMLDIGVPIQTAAFLLTWSGICALVGKPAVGRLSDRYDHRLLVALGGILAGLGYILVLNGDHPGFWRLAVGSAFMSAAPSFFFPMQGAIIGRYFGIQSFGRVIGLLNLFYLFGALGPLIGGAVRDHMGSYQPFVIGVATVPALMALFILWLKPEPRVSPLHRSGIIGAHGS